MRVAVPEVAPPGIYALDVIDRGPVGACRGSLDSTAFLTSRICCSSLWMRSWAASSWARRPMIVMAWDPISSFAYSSAVRAIRPPGEPPAHLAEGDVLAEVVAAELQQDVVGQRR